MDKIYPVRTQALNKDPSIILMEKIRQVSTKVHILNVVDFKGKEHGRGKNVRKWHIRIMEPVMMHLGWQKACTALKV